MLSQAELTNQQNVLKYTEQISTMLASHSETKTELETQIMYLQDTLEQKMEAYDKLRADKDQVDKKLADSIVFGDDNRRCRLSAENHVVTLNEEILKLNQEF